MRKSCCAATSALDRIGRLGRLAPILGALGLSSAGISGAQAAPAPNPAATALERHFQHEDALYGLRYSAETRTPADAMALHCEHEDRIYGGSREIRSAPSATKMLERHFRHEDALYAAPRSTSASSNPKPSAAKAAMSDGFDWSDAGIGAASTLVVLLLVAAMIVAMRRGRARTAQS
jgi:hypothetical protein